MITSMSDIICITNRKLCKGNFLERMDEIARHKPKAVILREKDMSEEEYAILAKEVMKICQNYDVTCVLHSFVKNAVNLGAKALHLPLPLLRQMKESERVGFKEIGTSCHSTADAAEAEQLGCTYIIAGHIFETDCKKGVPPRGLSFLSEVCQTVKIPVYAIGGINSENIASVKKAGAKGGCVMSGFMTCPDVGKFVGKFPAQSDVPEIAESMGDGGI